MQPLEPGDPRSVGPYTLSGRLGSGGAGVVYLAQRPGEPQPVALKLLRPELADEPSLRVRLSREAEAMRQVTSPCVVRVLDADTNGPRPYVVMEFAHGASLDRVLGGEVRLSEPDARRLGGDLAVALTVVHSAGLVHRDIKPSNVILGGDHARLADFGIASALEGSSLTRTGSFIGTQAWAAPEQLLGQPSTPAVDVFAWGLLVAWASTGRHPFGEGRTDIVMYRILHEEPDLTGVPLSLRPAVAAALAKDPDRRPTAWGLLDAVRQDHAQATTAVSPVGVAGATTAVTMAIPGDSGSGAPAAAAKRRRRPWVIAGVAVAVVLAVALGTFLLTAPDSTTVTLTVRPSGVDVGGSVAASGSVTPGEGRTVLIETSPDGTDWDTAATAVTDASGAYAADVELTEIGEVRLRANAAAAGRMDAAVSEVTRVTVTPPATVVESTDPFDDSGQPLPEFSVTRTVDGACVSSLAAGDAYECVSKVEGPAAVDTVFDPCYAAEGSDGSVLCIESPRGGDATEVAVRALGAPSRASTDWSPWYLTLEGDVGCRISGTSPSGGAAVTYACEDGRTGLGSPDRSSDVWTLRTSDSRGTDSATVRVLTAWF